MDKPSLMVGVKMKEVATSDSLYVNCTVLHSDVVALVFEVQRTISDGGEIETVVSQVLVPWVNIKHILLTEERT